MCMALTRKRAWTYRGCGVVDAAGEEVGTVADVWPADGGGEAELALVNLGRRFPRRRYVPLDDRTELVDRELRVPWSRAQIDHAPSAEDQRWGDPAHVALAYWRESAD